MTTQTASSISMLDRRPKAPPASRLPVRRCDDSLPVTIPIDHVGPVVIPGTGRLVYWTGRVAIGLRHERSTHDDIVPQSALWVQDLMLGPGHVAS